MDWLTSLKKAIDYMETHLLSKIGVRDVADAVHISPSYFQKSFKIVTGYSIGEYLRNRRLYLAALDVLNTGCPSPKDTLSGENHVTIQTDNSLLQKNTETFTNKTVLDLAYKYGYDTPESFSRAFSRFHGISPTQLKSQPDRIKVFLPLIVEISIRGGNKMEFQLEERKSMQMIGFGRIFSYDTSYQDIPKFWTEFCEKHCGQDTLATPEEQAIRQAIAECIIGEYGICVEDIDDGEHFHYYIAGAYQGGTVPDGMSVFEIPASAWAKFQCVGRIPQNLQTVNTRIFREWLPGNQEFEMSLPMNIEWYSNGNPESDDYVSAIWIPVKRL